MSARVFIDGEVGTTGLQIRARLQGRADIEIVSLSEANRKDANARQDMINAVDLAILCLPDAAARDAVAMVENDRVKIIDASTAHRVAEGWAYGFAEWDGQHSARIAASKRVSNPGCYALASIAIVNPLVRARLLATDQAVSIHAISGYSGGGKNMIANFEDETSATYTDAPYFVYGLGLAHKHVPEIQAHGGLSKRPLFMPSVGRFAQGMLVQVPLHLWDLPGSPTARQIHEVLATYYAGRPFVRVVGWDQSAAMEQIQAEDVNDTNTLRLFVFANEDTAHAVVMAQLDNLGKGAAGSCVQNLNLMLGFDETTGL